MTNDYLGYYGLEQYLFGTVRERFQRDGQLDAFDLFSIIIWKANRAKSLVAKRLLGKCDDLENAAKRFTRSLYVASTPEQRLLIAMAEWGFRLPMASAILTVLWPDEFTVYDVRASGELAAFAKLGNMKPDRVWPEYVRYREAIRNATPDSLPLQDKDRFLFGRSMAKQLAGDTKAGFGLLRTPDMPTA